MQINVKRSDLLRFYSTFFQAYPVALNKVHLTFCPNLLFLLSKVIASALSADILLKIEHDDKTIIYPLYKSGVIDKNILQDVLTNIDDSIFFNDDGTIDLTLNDGSSILFLLENLLLENSFSSKTQSFKNPLTYQKLFSIQKKLGYSNFSGSFLTKNMSPLNSGDILNVVDNSGVKTVKVLSEIEPFVYIVSIAKLKFGNEHKFPYGKKYAAVLLRDLISGCESSDKVCLFEYFNGLTKPLFCSISHNGTIISQTDLNYNAIIDSCLFTQGN